MNSSGSDINIVEEVLKIMLQARPDSEFIQSLWKQFCERGGLSKKQLEGLHSKASKVKEMSPARLATLEAIIKARPTRHRSEATITAKPEPKDEQVGKQLQDILDKYPQHKRGLFLKSRYDKGELLNQSEKDEIQKFLKFINK